MFHNYRLLGVIGGGTYGEVYKACLGRELPGPPYFDASSRPYYAIKRMRGNPHAKVPTVSELATLREVKLLKELHHVNIVPMIEVIVDSKKLELAIVFEYAELDVEKIIKHQKSCAQPLPDFTLKSILYQSLKGLEFLHDNWVMHRDLKPANILVIGDGPHKGRVLLADLGMSRIFRAPASPLGAMDKVVVTLWYRAPELLLGALDYTPAIDVWSMGCLLGDMFLAKDHNARSLFAGKELRPDEGGELPFQSEQCDCIFRTLGLPRYPEASSLPDYSRIEKWYADKPYPKASILPSMFANKPYIPESAIDLLSRMLDLDPQQRITAKAALSHEFLKKATDNCLMEYEYPSEPPKPLDEELEQRQHEEITQRTKRAREAALGISAEGGGA